MGRTIRKLIKDDSVPILSQIRHKMMKDATGTDFIVEIKGRNIISAKRTFPATAAIRLPTVSPIRNPDTMRRKEYPIEVKKSASVKRLKSLFTTATGVTSSRLSPINIALTCHMERAKTTDAIFSILFLFDVVEIIFRHFSPYGFRILIKQDV
jgi:hypothetical protein